MITEADVQLIMTTCHVDRNYAINLLVKEARMKIEYDAYLENYLDPRD